MAQRLLAGLDEHALHGAPPVVLVGRAHAVDLPLTLDGVAVLFPRHAQVHAGARVLEADSFIALPVDAVTLHRPDVQIVALTVLPERTDLLQTRENTFRAGPGVGNVELLNDTF